MIKSEPRIQLNRFIISVLISIPIMIGLIVSYVNAEHPAYVWDFGAYWHFFQFWGNQIQTGQPDWPHNLSVSIATADYNPLTVIPLAPFYEAFGGARATYVTAVALSYLLPTAVIATFFIGRSRQIRIEDLWLVFILAVSFVPFWRPTLRGQADIAGLVPLGLATILLLKTDFLRRRGMVAGILAGSLLGVLLYAPFLLRRWYAFAIVAFLAMAFVFGVVRGLRMGEPWLRAILRVAVPLSFTGLVGLCLLTLLQHDLALRIISTSYSDLYAGYQIDFAQHFRNIPGRLGWYVTILIVMGVLLAIRFRDTAVLFGACCATITFLLFIRTQQIDRHHFLPIGFWLLPAYASAAAWLAQYIPRVAPGYRLVPFALAAAILFVCTIIPNFERRNSIASFFVPKERIAPLHLPNYPEYRRLIAELGKQPDLDEGVTVFASNLTLSDALLQELAPDLGPVISPTPHVASTDFFRFDNLRARYALVVDPPQIQLAPGFQFHITLPGEMILRGQGFGAAYQRVSGPYTLANGAQAFIYRRTRPITVPEISDLIAQLDAHYPGWAEKYRRVLDVPFALRRAKRGPAPANVLPLSPDTLFLHPGETEPTSVTLPLDPSILDLPLTVRLAIVADVLKTCPDADGVEAQLSLDGTPLWSGQVLPGNIKDVNIPPEGGELTISVEKRSTLSCDHVTATFLRN